MATNTHTTVTLRLDLSVIIADLRQLADALEATQTKTAADKSADCRSEAETADDDH